MFLINNYKTVETTLKRLLFMMLVLLLVSIFGSCTEETDLKIRLNHFYQLLDNNSINAFEKGNLSEVVNYIESKQNDPNFNEPFLKLKKKEAINLFNNQQVVDFYYYNFYKTKTK